MLITDDREFKSILERLIAGYQPQRVIMFGSHVWGEPDEDSDVDLFIIKETSDRFIDRCYKIRTMIAPVRQAIPLDLIVLTPEEVKKRKDMGDQFITRILLEGTLLYDAA